MIKYTLSARINSCLSHTKTLFKGTFEKTGIKCIFFVFVWVFVCLFVLVSVFWVFLFSFGGFCLILFWFCFRSGFVCFFLSLFLFVLLFFIKFPPCPQWNLGVEEEESEKCNPMKSVEGLFSHGKKLRFSWCNVALQIQQWLCYNWECQRMPGDKRR